MDSMQLPVPEENSTTLTKLFIPTGQAKYALGRLDELMRDGWKSAYCMSLLVVGEPRVGKSHILKAFTKLRNAADEPGQQTVVRFEVPEAATLGRFLTEFLKGLNDPAPTSGSPEKRAERVWTALQRRRTRAVLLDETHRLVDERRRSPKRDVVDWVVRSLNRRACPLAFFGTEAMLPLFEGLPHMEGRTLGQVDLLPYKWSDKASRQEFRGNLHSFEEALEMSAPSGLATTLTAYWIWHFSEGYLGRVTRLLDHAMTVAKRDGIASLTDDVLASAVDELRIGAGRRLPNPFKARLVPPRADAVEAAA
jgi:hypothetical protein